VLHECGRRLDGEVEAEHPDPHGHHLEAVAASDQHAAAVGQRLDGADCGVDPVDDLLRRGVDDDPGVDGPAGAGDLAHHELGQVAREVRRAEGAAAGRAQGEPVQAVRRPRPGARVAADDVPPALPGDQPVRLQLDALVRPVERPQAVVVADRRGDLGEHGRIHLGVLDVGVGVDRSRARRVAQRHELAAQPVGQDVLELGQGPAAAVLEAGDSGHGAQPDRDRDRLLVVEKQWRELRADAEPVVPVAAAGRVDGVAELAEPGDVVAHRPVGDAEALGELGAGPVDPRLHQSQQLENPSRSCLHRAVLSGINCSGIGHSVVLTNQGDNREADR